MSDDKTEVIQVRVRENTLSQIDRLQAIVKSPSRSDAVRRSLELSDALVGEVLKGSRIIIEDIKGKQRQILLVGINA